MDTTLTDPLLGQTLDGRYRVESRIARGGMASVYLALDVRLDRMVAVKVMHRSLAEDPQFVRRFIGEAKSVASLSHPNVVQVFDQGTDGDHVYLSMEYFPGKTLRDVLRDRGRVPAREALEIMIPVLAALGAAHQAGLIHRDVKPENVLLTDDGRVKVVDFGLARAIEASNQTKSGIMIGTIAYMSPEQVTAGVADVRADVYAAGIVLYELLTGRQPYEGESPMSVAYRHVHDSVPAPSLLAPETPAALDALVLSATSKDPDQRPADAAAMLVAAVEAHRGLARATGPHTSPVLPGPAQHTTVQPAFDPSSFDAGPRAKRNLRPVWFIAALALVMVAGIAFSGWYFSQERYLKVPDLVKQNVKLAEEQARKLGFQVKIGEARFDGKVGKDIVLETQPARGQEVEKGSVLTIIASAGPEMAVVPKVENLSEADARLKVTEAGLTVSRVRKTASDKIDRGLAVRTDPVVGKRVRKGSSVVLVISVGLLTPDVTGMMRDQAQQFLAEKGYPTDCVNEVTDDTAPGTVIAQEPPGGAEMEPTTKICMTVSKGPDQPFWPWERDPSIAQPDFVTVPDVRFKDINDARKELQAAGFQVRVREVVGGRRVISQNPVGQVPQGTRITLWH
ncbi:serine/threonine protein kinase [Acrocarpospora phusangensis]|uniref:non-specific serine/threonine protein kinase n=1 Tax=Acrocarpospora phusangensis TaxID=1070424 RepID=A0A919UNX3_9ACTN|nr:Stk1 family PASTA domain-containing Ser/Thr kinase [Acrocarpospora phusangensis]GIH23090.1 serine/threonine protein kinase [Acrocarpospora phusangensis]